MPKVPQEHSIVAVYESHTAAEDAVGLLQVAGVDMSRLSVIGKNLQTEEHATGFYTVGDRVKFWGLQGAFWGGLWGVLFGSALFFLPAIGPIIAMGPLVTALAAGVEGAAFGGAAGVLGGALASIGIPAHNVIKYQVDIKAGRYLVIARGTTSVMEHVRSVLVPSGAVEITTQS